MKWIERAIASQVQNLVSTRPAVLLTGIRQSGKSALLQKLFPRRKYVSFDHYRYSEAARENPETFLASFKNEPVILDEVQYVPGLFSQLKILIDENRYKNGHWILTGSQKFVLMESARESLAGRIGLMELETLGAGELRSDFSPSERESILWKGGFPELWANRKIKTGPYLDDYISTYLEKDLRSIIQTPNLTDFHKLLRTCALRAGALVNFSDISRDIGISPNTAKSWIQTLAKSGIITLLEPWFANISKRLTKTPKLFFNDQGLLCHLLNIHSLETLSASPFLGTIWENFVFNELIRTNGISSRRNLYFYRDQNQVEVDFLIEAENSLFLIEAKAAEQPQSNKIGISKVRKVLGNEKTVGLCACRIPEAGLFPSADCGLINPLFSSFEEIVAAGIRSGTGKPKACTKH